MNTPIQTGALTASTKVKTVADALYHQTAETIASNLGAPIEIVQKWVAAGHLPTLASGLHDRSWATCLCRGRRDAGAWRDTQPAAVVAAFGWLRQALDYFGHTPTAGNLELLVSMFKRNGLTRPQAMQAFSVAQARMERA